MAVLDDQVMRSGVGQVDLDFTGRGAGHDGRRGRGGALGHGEVAHIELAGVQVALTEELAVEHEPVGLLGRVGKAGAAFECERVLAGSGQGELAAPAYRVVVGVDLG